MKGVVKGAGRLGMLNMLRLGLLGMLGMLVCCVGVLITRVYTGSCSTVNWWQHKRRMLTVSTHKVVAG